jgi:hypothetical protein
MIKVTKLTLTFYLRTLLFNTSKITHLLIYLITFIRNLKLLRARNFYNIILTPLNIIIIFINLFLFGIAASTLFGKCLTVKNVRCTWYRLSNITVHSFHTLSPIFFFHSKILVKPFVRTSHPIQVL